MPVPQFRWIEYTVDAPRSRSAGAAAGVAPDVRDADAGSDTIPLPDLAAWPTPLDKARILLESAAEIEHALMVQYLYAAYSLKRKKDVDDPAQKKVLDERPRGSANIRNSWPVVIREVAREEMGHLMTVQNLLLALGLPPNLEREDFPPRKDIYPFALHLEPLTKRSLAKYVVAEAPTDADIDDVESALNVGKPRINHVGVLYGLLGVVFATAEQVVAGRTSGDPWDEWVGQVADAAYQQCSAREAWHLPDSAFAPAAVAPQAEPSDWQVGAVRVHAVTGRETARAAIEDIGEQGEGPTTGTDTSHFERFLRIFRGDGPVLGFPDGEWIPTKDVPTDPTPAGCPDPDTRRWVELADLSYGLLLGFVEHYLTAVGDDRELLMGWIFAEMRTRLGHLAPLLPTMPTGAGGMAGMPFTLPTPIHLPAVESERWTLHAQRVQAVITKVEAIQAAGGTTATAQKDYLDRLLAADRSRLAFLTAHASPPVPTSFVRDIAPLFRHSVDVEHMKTLVNPPIDLSIHEVVADKSADILDRLRATDGLPIMPPPPDPPWTEGQIALFGRWVAEGHPE